MGEKEALKKALDSNYTKSSLLKLYDNFMKDWISKSYIGKNLGFFEAIAIGESSKKEIFLDLIYEFYGYEEVFLTIFETFSDDVKRIFDHIAWKGKYFLNETEKKDLLNSVKENYKTKLEPKVEYLFFSLHMGTHWNEEDKTNFYLSEEIIKALRKYLPKPVDYYINPIKNAQYEYYLTSEEEFLQKIKIYLNFYIMGEVKLSASNKLLKASKKALKKYGEIKECYEDEGGDLEYLKTETIALFLLSMKEELLNDRYLNGPNAKNIFNDFFSGEIFNKEKFNFTTKFLNYLKGVKNIWNEEEHLTEILGTLKTVLLEMPEGQIVSVDNILNYINFRTLYSNLISPQNIYDHVYINEADYGRTKIYNYETYYEYIVVPMFKSLIGILGSLGVVDLYIDTPTMKNGLYLKNGYLSKYDGIKYIKLSNLGEYVLGRKKEYDFGEIAEESEVYLDEDRLIITIVGNSPMKAMFLEQIGLKIGANKYKLDYNSILRNIENSNDLSKRIDDFRKKITLNMPPLWQSFFEELKTKHNSITACSDLVVFKLKEDKELINLVARDEILKDIVFKAEGYHIIIKEENIKTVLKRLESFGYYND